uniref:Diphthine--ammonia ligase n=1 Tax=Paramormyrops kingsleyae TaxID=1676925 RepID=A0A3B3S952_9TELE
MKVVAMISGGKDSCYNMMQCVAAGHEIVALANLQPSENKDELDSYMYQTVGHQAINLYAEALDLPLYRRVIEGSSLNIGRGYRQREGDEVEDMYHLLKQVKEDKGVEAVSVGAILSDYQRVRVENVCARLHLQPLAYLWRRDQEDLLSEMISSGLDAIIIKVAAFGLDPEKHLGKSLVQMKPYLKQLSEKYGVHVCGEGGEYETFTLDCPLFKKKILMYVLPVLMAWFIFTLLIMKAKGTSNYSCSGVMDLNT